MNAQKLMDQILDEVGSVKDSLHDSVMPGICRECYTVHDSCEPDMREGNCENCSKNTVVSCMELVFEGADPFTEEDLIDE